LTELRRLDGELLIAVLRVLAMDSCPQREVHEQLNLVFNRRDMGDRFEWMAYDFNLPGAVERQHLPALPTGPAPMVAVMAAEPAARGAR